MVRLHIIQNHSKQNIGNVCSLTSMKLCSGQAKILIALSGDKVYFIECKESIGDEGGLNPIIREVSFTLIPGDWNISSIDSFNKSNEIDNFYIGIAVENTQINSDGVIQSQLLIYSEPNTGSPFNIESIAQNCYSIQLNFQPHCLKHTYLVEITNGSVKKDIVWLLCGTDLKVHMYREDPPNHSYFEDDVVAYFSEFANLTHFVMWFDIKYIKDLSRRITAIGYDASIYEIYSMDTSTNTVLHMISEVVLQVVSRVEFFSLKPQDVEIATDNLQEGTTELVNDVEVTGEDIHLLVCLGMSPSVVYMNVDKDFHNVQNLEESESNDITLCACIGDVNFDGCNEIILGNYGRKFMFYQLTKDGWELLSQMNAPDAVYGMIYSDIIGDGVDELIVSSGAGIHVFQHNLDDVQNIILLRLKETQLKDDDGLAPKTRKLKLEREELTCEEVYED